MQTIFRMPGISSALIAVGLVMPTAVGAAPVVEIKQSQQKGGVESDIGVTTILVDGAGSDRYDKVVNTSLDFWVTVSGSTPDNASAFRRLKLRAAGGTEVEGTKPGDARIYRLTAPYADPRSETVVNQRISPVVICNAEIARRSGAARAAYLKTGGTVFAQDAYGLSAVATWELWPGGVGFKEPYPRDFTSTDRANVAIECRPLDRPKPRTQTQTQGVPGRPGQKMEPTLKTVSLKLEPFANQTVGGQQCPTRVRLYGFIETRRAFVGKSIFMGPYFLTPITKLDFKAAGTRTVVAEYPVKWGNAGAKASGPGLKKQQVTLRLNVANPDGKVLESAERTVELACRPTRVG